MAVLAAVWSVSLAPPVGAATTPRLSMAPTTTVIEGDSGTARATVPVTLDVPASSPVTVAYETVDGTAKVAKGDYVATSGSVTIPAGATSASIAVTLRGDTALEDYESLKVRLSSPVGAAIAKATGVVMIANDEQPRLAAANVKVVEGEAVRFRPRLAQRYFRTVSVTAQTVNGSAKAPDDYTTTNRTFTIPAASKTAVDVPVPTRADAIPESNEKFTLRVSGTDVVATISKSATITDAPACAAGTPGTPPARTAPPSPSPVPGFLPPDQIRNGEWWDLVFHDEFDHAPFTAASWDTGMRSGARTLEGNGELQWYLPGNSVLATDQDAGTPVTVLRQGLQATTVPGQYYTVRTLSRLYPPAVCPHLYDPARMAPTDPTLVPYRFTSGMLNSSGSFAFRYGYVEARAKLPRGFALWPALWLRNSDPWSYEIDVMEGFDRDARVTRSTYWWGDAQHFGTNMNGGDIGIRADGGACRGLAPLPVSTSDPSQCSLANAVDLSAGYHTFGLWWAPTGYTLFVDGVARWTSPPGADVDSSYNHLILNLAFGNNAYEFDWLGESVRPLDAGLLGTGWFPKPTVEWDYVRVWQPESRHDYCTTGNC